MKRPPLHYLGTRTAVRLAAMHAAVDAEFARGCDIVHVVPCFAGEREHVESISCWCVPSPDSQEPRVIVHRRRGEA